MRQRAAYFREYRARQAASRAEAKGELLPFQKAFVDAVEREEDPVDSSVLSVPRGNGKSWLCGKLIARSLTPGDVLHEKGVENILVSASRAQAAIVLDFARQAMAEDAGVRWRADGAIHVDTRARVRIISSDSKRALGLGASVRLIVADEPGAWGPTAGRRLWDAILTSLGKRRTTLIAIGTLAPAALTGPASWWPSFVASGSGDGRHISLLQANADEWRNFSEVLRVNPVSAKLVEQPQETVRHKSEPDHRAARPSRRYRREEQTRLVYAASLIFPCVSGKKSAAGTGREQ